MWHWTNGQLTFNVSAQLIDLLFTLKVGSIEGRVGVHHVDDSQQSKNFTFKCHRDGNDIFSVNSLNFHPVSPLSSIIYSNKYHHSILNRTSSRSMKMKNLNP